MGQHARLSRLYRLQVPAQLERVRPGSLADLAGELTVQRRTALSTATRPLD